MENKEIRNENFPVIAIKAIGDEYGLVSMIGPELMFQRLGEFLACMMEQTGFYVTKVDKDDKVDSTNLVEMEPYDGQDAEDNKEDLDQDSSDID